mgnify:CR=1 FL=1
MSELIKFTKNRLDAYAEEGWPGQGGVSLPQKIGEAKHATEATAQAAAITGTNRQYVSDAKRISTEAPNLAVLQSRTAKNKKRHPAQSPGVFAFLWGWVLA